MSDRISILSSDSLEKFRSEIIANPKVVNFSFQEIVEKLSLKLIDLETLEAVPKLILPKSISWGDNSDFENSKIIFKFLANLNLSDAKDERIWTSLAFQYFRDYMNIRWPAKSNSVSDVAKNYIGHYFCPTSRNRWRDHGIARLWWVTKFVCELDHIEVDDGLGILYSNSELINSFLGHPRTVTDRHVGGALLQFLSMKEIDKKSNFDREIFRRFMVLLDLRSAKISLATLQLEELSLLFSELYSISEN